MPLVLTEHLAPFRKRPCKFQSNFVHGTAREFNNLLSLITCALNPDTDLAKPKGCCRENWQEGLGKCRSHKSAFALSLLELPALQQQLCPSSSQLEPCVKGMLERQIPSYRGMEMQSENHQHSSKSAEEVVIPLFLHSVINEGSVWIWFKILLCERCCAELQKFGGS